MKLSESATLVDVAYAVCTALARVGVVCVLTGGSAATFYVTERYQSLDVDFVFRFVPRKVVVDEAMGSLGYVRAPTAMYEHLDLPITVDFPRGPMSVGRDLIQAWATERRGDELLHVLGLRNDRSALELALEVAQQHRERFDADTFRAWTAAEHVADASYAQEKVDEFFRRLAAGPSGATQGTTER